jgi:hypothetical protein
MIIMEQTTLEEHGWPSESVVEDLTLSKAMASFDRFLGEGFLQPVFFIVMII